VSGFDPGEVENIPDNGKEMLLGAHDAQHCVPLLLCRGAIKTIEHQLRVAADGVERRPQIVRHA
jgi:hypothetical protein